MPAGGSVRRVPPAAGGLERGTGPKGASSGTAGVVVSAPAVDDLADLWYDTGILYFGSMVDR